MNIRKLLCALLLLLLPASGCWDLKDLNERAFVTAIGLDLADKPLEASGIVPNRYKVTVEILRPNLLKESSWRLGSNNKASVVYTAEGESIQKALGIIQTRVPLSLSLAHLNILIIGEELARESLKSSLNYFEKQPEVARRVRFLLAKGCQAQEILKVEPSFFRYLSEELVAMGQLELDISIAKTESFSNILKDMRTNNGMALGTRVFLSEEQQIIRHGASVLNDWKLVGWLSKDETRHANWLKGKGFATVVGKSEDGIFTYHVEQRKLKIEPNVENGDIRFKVELSVDGSIWQEEEGNLNLSNPRNIKKLEQLFIKVIKGEIEDAIHKAQKDFQVDYLGFGMKLMNKYPKIFKNTDWEKTFPNVPINVQVEANISRFGQTR